MTDDVERSEAEKERAAIVAWLREEAKAQMRVCENNARFHGYETAAKAQMLSARYEAIADAVSRGEHLQDRIDSEALAELIAMDADLIAEGEG